MAGIPTEQSGPQPARNQRFRASVNRVEARHPRSTQPAIVKRALIVAATVVTFLGFAGRSDALDLCNLPPIEAGLVSIDGEPYTTQITSDRGAVVQENMVVVWADFVDRLNAANDQSWNSNAEVRFYTLTGGTIRLQDTDEFVLHVFDGAGIVKMPEDGTASGTVIAPEAVFDFDKPYSLLDGAVVAKRITASGLGGGRVTGNVGTATLICTGPAEITPVGNIVPEAPSEDAVRPSNSLAVTGTNMLPAFILIVSSALAGVVVSLWVSVRAASEHEQRRRDLHVVSRLAAWLAKTGSMSPSRRKHVYD